MSHDTVHSDKHGDFSPKQRLELERWARLNDMTLEEFLESDLHQKIQDYREKRKRREQRADEAS